MERTIDYLKAEIETLNKNIADLKKEIDKLDGIKHFNDKLKYAYDKVCENRFMLIIKRDSYQDILDKLLEEQKENK